MKDQRKRSVTITEVAAAAGVSIGTVSRYLNDLPVKVENHGRIAQAIEDLGYRRNTLASVMKASRTGVIGILVPNLDDFHSRLVYRLTEKLRELGLMSVTHSHDNSSEAVAKALDFFKNYRVDALVLGGSQDHANAILNLIEDGTNVVTYDNPHTKLSLDCVDVDNIAGAEAGVRHLIDAGHTRIGFLAGREDHGTSRAREEGWRRALLAAGLEPADELVQVASWTRVGGASAMAQLLALENPPTAVFGGSFRMTIGAIKHLSEIGLKIPEDISVVSFDDSEVFQLMSPPITVVAQPVEAIATAIVGRVAAHSGLRPADYGTPTSQRLKCELISRGSVGRPKS